MSQKPALSRRSVQLDIGFDPTEQPDTILNYKNSLTKKKQTYYINVRACTSTQLSFVCKESVLVIQP